MNVSDAWKALWTDSSAPGSAAEIKDSFFTSKRLWVLIAIIAAIIWYKDVIGAMIWPVTILASVYIISETWSKVILAKINSTHKLDNVPDLSWFYGSESDKITLRMKLAAAGCNETDIKKILGDPPTAS